ncbi:MAG: hypothetical protein M0Z53_00120 [Thermaerobacter sp.]|nr:hypothetical protein [Thermaerobacter sp.]
MSAPSEDCYRLLLRDLADEERQAGAAWFGPEACEMVRLYGPAAAQGLPPSTESFVRQRLGRERAEDPL